MSVSVAILLTASAIGFGPKTPAQAAPAAGTTHRPLLHVTSPVAAITAQADLAVSVSGSSEAVAGDPGNFIYTIQVTSAGPDDAQSVTLTDSLPAGEALVSQSQASGPAFTLGNAGDNVTDTIATLAAGAAAAFTVTVHVSGALAEGTVLSNSANVASSTPDPVTANNVSTATTVVHVNADLSIRKTGPPDAVAGDPANLTYTITVTNDGPSDAQAVALHDTLPAGETLVSQSQATGPTFTLGASGNTITDTISSLNSGASASFSVVVNISGSVADQTLLSNTATVTSSSPDLNTFNNSSTADTTVHAPLPANLSVSKTGPAETIAGDPANLTYTITVSNQGPGDAFAAALNDTLPSGETFVSQAQTSGPAFTLGASGNAISDTIATLAAGASATFTVTVHVSASVPEGTVLSNTATVGNSSSTASTLVHAQADVAVSKTGPAEAFAGDPANLTYTITVSNYGPSDAQGVSWSDTVPAGETLVSQAQKSGPAFVLSTMGNTIADSVGTLPAGASASFTVTVHLSTSLAEGTVLSNTAAVTARTTDPNPGNNTSTASTLLHAPADLAVSKTGPSTVVAGNLVTYRVAVANNGPGAAQGVTLTDVLPAAETFVSQSQTSGPAFTLSNSGNTITDTIAVLAAGDMATFTVTVRAPAQRTILSNTAVVSSTTPDPNPRDNSSTATTVVFPSADLAVTKAGPATAVAGDQRNVVYTITVTDNGPSDAQAVVLSDVLPAGETFVSQSQTSGPAFTLSNSGNSISDTIATLPVGTSAGFTVVAHVSADVPNGTLLRNVASVTSNTSDPDRSNNTSEADTTVAAQADVQVTKTGPAQAVAGDPADITYTITVANNGPSDAQGVVLGDSLPAGETFVSLSQTAGPAFTPGVTGDSFSESINTLTSGASATFTVVVHVSSSVQEGTVLSNTASVSSSTTDPNTGNNSSTVSTVVHNQSADVAVSKTGPAETIAGDPANVTYTITVANNGPGDAHAVVLSDALPAGETFVSQSQTSGPAFTLSNSGNSINDTIAALAAGATATFTVTVHVSASVPEGAVLSNTAVASSSTTDPDPTNNSSTASTLVHARADLAVSKTGPAEAIAGDPANLTYTITVANNGPSDAQAVALTDALPAGETFVSQSQTSGPAFTLSNSGNSINDTIAALAAGATATFTVTVHVSASVPEGAVLSNTAVASSSTTDPDPTNNSSTTSTLVHARADVAVSKTGPAEAIAGDPANLTYTITVANNGPSDAQAVVLSDALPAGETFVSQSQTSGPAFALSSTPTSINDTIATLAAGASATFTVTVHVSPSVPEGAVLSNTAAAGHSSSTASTLVHARADLAVSKTGPASAVAGDPANLTYTITVVNNGPSDAQAVSLTDALLAGETLVSQSQTSGPAFTQSSTATSIDDTIATLPAGASATFTVTVHVSSSVPEGTVLANTAVASSSTTDPAPTNNSSTASTLVTDARISARGVDVSASEGQPFSGQVATFCDPDPGSAPAEYSATIDWGDGTPRTTGTISAGGASGCGNTYTVSGSHSYSEEGAYTITVTMTDTDTAANSATATGTARVSDAPLTAGCAAPSGATGAAFNGPTATFVDASPAATAADFTATIDWGDGSTSAGTISGSGPYTVSGTHTYSVFGLHAIKTTINDDGGQSTVASCAPVFVYPPTTTPACDVDAAGVIKAMNGDWAAFADDITPPQDVDGDEDGQPQAQFENAVVYVDIGPSDRFVFVSTQILAVTCNGSASSTIYGVGTVSDGTQSVQVFFIEDLTAAASGQPATKRLRLFGAHPYDSGTQAVAGSGPDSRD